MNPHHKRLIRKYMPPHPLAKMVKQHFIQLEHHKEMSRLQFMMVVDAFSYMPPDQDRVDAYMKTRFSSYFAR